MPATKQLREERMNLASRMREILDAPAGEERDGKRQLSAEQETEFDRLHERTEELGREIDAAEKAERENRGERLRAIEAELNASQGVRAGRQDTTEDRKVDAEERAQATSRAFENYLRYGLESLTHEERALVQPRFQRPEGRAMSVGQDSAGGYLVPEGFANQIVSAMKAFGGMRRARTFQFTTESGNALPIPTDDDTSNKGEILGEGGSVNQQDVTIGQVVLNAYTFSSKMVKVSFELLQDSAFDIQSYLSRKLGERIGRKANELFTTGSGASQPYGIATQAANGVTAASATAITWDELLDLKHSVDPDYRSSAEWMFNDSTLKLIKKLKDGEGRPLWQPSVIANEPALIDGDPYVVNQDVASAAASGRSVLYGDFSLYYIRDVRGITLLRLNERFADNHQVAFLAFSRHDGVLVDAGQNPVKRLTQAA